MPITDSLISYYKLEEASGSRADEVGSNTLTDNNSVTQSVGILGNAAHFQASGSQYLSHADNAALSTGNIDFSIAAWVYLDSKSANAAIVSKASGSQVEYLLMYDQVNDRFSFEIWDTTLSTKNSVLANNLGSPALTTWYYVVAWYDSVNSLLKISVNNGTADSTSTTITPPDSTGAFEVGRYAFNGSRYWDGRIDALGFWKRVLSASDRTSLYNSGSGLEYPFSTAVTSNVGPPEVRQGPPLIGSPWFKPFVERGAPPPAPAAVVAATPSSPVSEVRVGPPLRGAPWFKSRIEPFLRTNAQPSGPSFTPEIRTGPPMRGAPWSQHLRIELGLNIKPTTTITPTGRVSPNKPFLSRVPSLRGESDQDRMRRFTEKLSLIMNSLIGQGQLVQTDIKTWTLNPPAAAALTAIDGGTF